MRVPYPLIRRFVQGGHIAFQRELAVFLKLKVHFHNSVIYNYSTKTLREVSKKTQISVSSLRKYINIFLDGEWCHTQGNHLVLKTLIEVSKLCGCITEKRGYNKIGKSKKTEKLIIKKTHNVKDILCEIRFQVILKNKKAVDYFREVLRDYEKSKDLKNKKEYSDYKKKLRQKLKYNLDDKNFILKNGWLSTLKTIARNIGGMSASTACRMMKHAQLNERVIIKTGKFKFIRKYIPARDEILANNTFFFAGFLCKREVNQYVFL